MTLTVELPRDLERRLKVEATRTGIEPGQRVTQLLDKHLQPYDPAAEAQAIRDMFARWAEEDRTDDPDELARREREWKEFKQAMNESHTSYRKIFP